MRLKLFVVSIVLASSAASAAFAASSAKIHVALLGEGGSGMEIRLTPSTVRSGKVEFDVSNEAITESHEVVLVALKSKDQTIPISKDKHRIDESKLKSLGEVSGLKAGEHGKLVANLRPGTYELLCNIQGHYEAGMHALLTVTQ